jgi:hypothetical protein
MATLSKWGRERYSCVFCLNTLITPAVKTVLSVLSIWTVLVIFVCVDTSDY